MKFFNAGSSKNNFNKMMVIKKIKKFVKNFKVVLQKDSADQRDYKVDFSKLKKFMVLNLQLVLIKALKKF